MNDEKRNNKIGQAGRHADELTDRELDAISGGGRRRRNGDSLSQYRPLFGERPNRPFRSVVTRS